MARAAHEEWGNWINVVKDELAAVVQFIVCFGPVRLLAPRKALVDARVRFGDGNIEVIDAPEDGIPLLSNRCS